MKPARTSLLLLGALFISSGSTAAHPVRVDATSDTGLLAAVFQPGETARYTFTQKVNLRLRVNPRTPSDKVPPFTPRRYEVDGEIVATFASRKAGEPLRGMVLFKGLMVKDWASSVQVTDLEAALRRLEATELKLASASDGRLELSELPLHLVEERFAVDVEDLRSVAQAVFLSRISNQPLMRGQQRESPDFPIPGMIKPGIKMTIVTDYLDDIPIAHHPSAEVRLSMNVPYQSHAVSPESGAAKMSERLDATGVWTYLLDLDAHQISFLHKTVQTETSYSVESTDNNESVRIPQSVFTVNKEYEVTARRVPAKGSAEREADLDSFEKSLDASGVPLSAKSAAPSPSPGSEVSLGDLARRLREEGNAQGGGQPVPDGFKRVAFPSGSMTALVSAQAAELERDSDRVSFHASLGDPRPIVITVLMEFPLLPAESANDALDRMVSGLQGTPGVQVLRFEKKTINGLPGVVIGARQGGERPSQVLQACVVSGDKVYAASCGTLPEDFPQVEHLCRTVVESTHVQ